MLGKLCCERVKTALSHCPTSSTVQILSFSRNPKENVSCFSAVPWHQNGLDFTVMSVRPCDWLESLKAEKLGYHAWTSQLVTKRNKRQWNVRTDPYAFYRMIARNFQKLGTSSFHISRPVYPQGGSKDQIIAAACLKVFFRQPQTISERRRISAHVFAEYHVLFRRHVGGLQ